MEDETPVHGGNGGYCPVARQFQHHRVHKTGNAARTRLVDETLRVLWTSEIFFELPETKAGMDALVQDPTQKAVPFNDQNVRQTVFMCGDSRGKAGGTASDDDEIVVGIHWSVAASAGIVHAMGRSSKRDGRDCRRRPRNHPPLADDDSRS